MKIKNRAGKRDKKKRQRQDEDSSDEDSDVKQVSKKQKTSLDETKKPRSFANTKEVIRTREFKLRLWAGPPGEENPSEETKLLRKSIGVNVRGHCQDSPPPLISLLSEFLPPLFNTYCQQNHIRELTPIQKQSWPSILNGANIIGISPTGSGKTLAFALPAIHHILSAPTSSYRSNKATPFVLVLAPARELAIQIHAVFKSCRQVAGTIKSALLYGGQEKQQQVDQIRSMGNQCRVLVATPGRLLDVLNDPESPLDLNQVSYQVIDEADRMLAMGFLEQLQDIATFMHPARQILLFSATFPGKLRDICAQWMSQHVMIRVNTIQIDGIATSQVGDNSFVPESQMKEKAIERTSAISESAEPAPTSHAQGGGAEEAVTQAEENDHSHNKREVSTTLHASALTVSPSIQQLIHVCAAHKKPRLLIKFIERIRTQEKEEKKRQADPMIIFCNKIKTLGFVQTFLKKNDVTCVALHGNIPQSQREENLNNFRSVFVTLLHILLLETFVYCSFVPCFIYYREKLTFLFQQMLLLEVSILNVCDT